MKKDNSILPNKVIIYEEENAKIEMWVKKLLQHVRMLRKTD